MIIDFNNYLNYKIFKYQVIYILKSVSIYIISKSIVCIITMLIHGTIYYLIIVIYYFWYFYVKNVILGLGNLFPYF